VGYLPEERGLYRDLKVAEVLVYLAELKGTPRSVGHERAMRWLEQVDLGDWANRKVKDLSRGMQQKLQFVASLVHDPDLLILDEPFQGLDPINVDLLQDLIRRLQQDGKTIVLSAHQMNLVEEMCDRIVLINKGKRVLYGDLDEIKNMYSPQTVRLRTQADVDLTQLPGVVRAERHNGKVNVLTLDDEVSPQALLAELVRRRIPVQTFEIAATPLEEIFIAVVKEQKYE
jgi:ABC-2 type transport system ATP-binding protein